MYTHLLISYSHSLKHPMGHLTNIEINPDGQNHHIHASQRVIFNLLLSLLYLHQLRKKSNTPSVRNYLS